MSIQLAHKAVLAFIRGSSPAAIEIDYMEYGTDGAAQAAWVTSATAYTAQYPPAHSDTYVKATTTYGASYHPYFATDPTKSLTGSSTDNSFLTDVGSQTNQRFHFDLGSSKIINRIYYESYHDSGSTNSAGFQNFILQGSNTGAGTFDDLVYANDEGWTQITGLSQSTFDEHTSVDEADPKYITITGNTTAYRYYALKIADGYGNTAIGMRRIELQTADIIAYSEPTIKTQGIYAMKLSATTNALNETLTKTLTGGDILDLTGKNSIVFDIRCTGTGASIIQAQITDVGTTNSTYDITISTGDTWEEKTWDISGISAANKDAINKVIFKILNADSARTYYIDNLRAI